MTEQTTEFDYLNAEGWIALESSSHLPEKNGIGCICGFCVWSPEHVAVMSYRDGIRAALAHHRCRTVSPKERAHDSRGQLDRSICGACGDAYRECSKCGVYFCECGRSGVCTPPGQP